MLDEPHILAESLFYQLMWHMLILIGIGILLQQYHLPEKLHNKKIKIDTVTDC